MPGCKNKAKLRLYGSVIKRINKIHAKYLAKVQCIAYFRNVKIQKLVLYIIRIICFPLLQYISVTS